MSVLIGLSVPSCPNSECGVSYLPHLACAAFLAISTRLSGVSLAALATPPFNPPRCPRALKSMAGLGFKVQFAP